MSKNICKESEMKTTPSQGDPVPRTSGIATEAMLCCPVCKGDISLRGDFIICDSCSAEFPLLDGGIPDFSMNRDFYYGTLPQATMQLLLQKIDQASWKTALREIAGTLPPRKQEGLIGQLREERTAWKYLLPISSDMRVLDYGCGLGSSSVALARSFGEVVSLDLTAERIMFVKRRSEALGLKNMVFVRGGDAPFLPFPDQSFDVFVLNGVLEWIAESRQGSPKEIHARFLQEVNRVLKDNGHCYIGIENRFGYRYFLGKRDDHSNLLFGSLLPRRIANLYSLAAKGKPYSTYTYSVGGYRRLLRKAGFRSCRFFLPYPTYRQFSQIVGGAQASDIAPRLKVTEGEFGHAAKFFNNRLLKYFARSFSIIASKERTPQCFLEQLTARVLQERSRQSSGDWSGGIRHILISTGKVTVVVGGCKGHANDLESGLLIKIPLTPDGQLALERNFRTLESIGEDTRRFKAVAAYVPRSFGRGEFLGQPYFVEESIPGVAGETVRLNGSAKSNIMKTAGDLLTKLHLATQSWSVIDVSIFERRFAKAIREVAYFLGYENQRGVLEQLTSNLGKMVLGARLPLIWCHGDFSLKNVLVSSSKISGLIGWELAETRALPLLDMLHLLLRDRIVEEKLSMRGVISKYLVPLNLTSGGDLLSDYIEALSIDRSLILPLSIMYWVNRIHGHIGSLNDLDADWVNENFVQVINDLNREL